MIKSQVVRCVFDVRYVMPGGFFSQGRCGADGSKGTKEGAQGASTKSHVLLHSDDLAINHGTFNGDLMGFNGI